MVQKLGHDVRDGAFAAGTEWKPMVKEMWHCSYNGGIGTIIEISNNVTLSGNTVRHNTASTSGYGNGGGLYIELCDDATLSGNTIVSNTATLSAAAEGLGGGLTVESSSSCTLVNNLVADNHANTQGSGQGVFVGEYTTLAFTNTIIAGHAGVGVMAATGSAVTLEATLWHNNGADTGGGGSIVPGTIGIHDDPVFVDPAAWDYHLDEGSMAIDKGVDAGVLTDIDGGIRDAPPRHWG